MTTVTMNKLVRDRICELIHKDHGRCSLSLLSGASLKKALDQKLDEEYLELKIDDNMEEAADLAEVTLTLLHLDHMKKSSFTMTADATEIVDMIGDKIAAYHETEKEHDLFDLLKLLQLYAKNKGSSFEALESIRMDKKRKKGGFSDGVYISSVLYPD